MTPRRTYPDWYDPADAKEVRARLYGGDVNAPTERPGGILAQHDQPCELCPDLIERHRSTVVNAGDRISPKWVHAHCHARSHE